MTRFNPNQLNRYFSLIRDHPDRKSTKVKFIQEKGVSKLTTLFGATHKAVSSRSLTARCITSLPRARAAFLGTGRTTRLSHRATSPDAPHTGQNNAKQVSRQEGESCQFEAAVRHQCVNQCRNGKRPQETEIGLTASS